jgi:hypothetical protein
MGDNWKLYNKNCAKACSENNVENEVEILCNKPSQQTKSMKTNA